MDNKLLLLAVLATLLLGCEPSADSPAPSGAAGGSPPEAASANETPVTLVVSQGGKAPSAGSQADLATAFSALPEVLLALQAPYDFRGVKIQAGDSGVLPGFQAMNAATLRLVDGGLEITATADDPWIVLPPFIQDKRAILRVDIDSTVDTNMQIFAKTRENPTYTEEQSQVAPIKKGSNTVFFRLDRAALIDPIRLDPGESAGVYVVRRLVARKLK